MQGCDDGATVPGVLDTSSHRATSGFSKVVKKYASSLSHWEEVVEGRTFGRCEVVGCEVVVHAIRVPQLARAMFDTPCRVCQPWHTGDRDRQFVRHPAPGAGVPHLESPHPASSLEARSGFWLAALSANQGTVT